MHVWTNAEIQGLPEFGSDHGWFYGIVRDGHRIRFAEILPGLGYTSPWPMWSPRSWWWAIQDVLLRESPSSPEGTGWL